MPRRAWVARALLLLVPPVGLLGAAATALAMLPLPLGYLYVKALRARTGRRAESSSNLSMRDGGSMTAVWVLLFRAVAASCGFGPDRDAGQLVNHLTLTPQVPGGWLLLQVIRWWSVLQFKLTRRVSVYNVKRAAGVAYLQARTCWLDDVVERFAEHAGSSPSQLVILGAGYDTRCHRLPLPASVAKFEVDAPGTQARKMQVLEKLSSNGLLSSTSSTATFVSCNFARESWLQKLTEAGFKKELPTCFVWEGVTMYLPQEVIESTLRTVKDCGAGSVIGFDYFNEDAVGQFRCTMVRLGEPFGFLAQPAQVPKLVQGEGLRVLDHLHHEELERRYVPRLPSGGYVGLVHDIGAFMLAGN